MVTATHQERLGALRTVLDAWGYGDTTSEGFPIWMPQPQTILRADLVAFIHREQRDMSTSAIVAQVVDLPADIPSHWIPAAEALGAPALLAATPELLTLWSTATQLSSPIELGSVPITNPSLLISQTTAITPDVVARAKSRGYSPTLFPVGLERLGASRSSARAYLKTEVEHAIDRFNPLQSAARNDIIARIVVAALAVLMIRDKAMAPSMAGLGPGALIDIAQQRHPGYFQWLNSLSASEMDAFSILVDQLGTNINFASLEPGMVSDVYEQALVNKLVRRKQGTFYTPPLLAQQMVDAIPFEQIEPEQRTILDPACGSGTMLLAAASRLSGLQPNPNDMSACHQYLISHLRGFDDDSLATEITRLSLLMSAMPIGNSWNIQKLDTLETSLPDNDKPSVIISNPPWKFHRSQGVSEERANRFLTWMIDNLAPDGFLACIVPLSWITKDVSKSSRADLLHRAELVDLWRLPSSIFKLTSSAIAPAVLVARKKRIPGYARHMCLVKTIREMSTESFLAIGQADESYIVEPGPDGRNLIDGPLTRAVRANPEIATISAAAEVYTGRPKRTDRPIRSREEATHYELGSLRLLHYFARTDLSELLPVRYPEDYGSSRSTDERVRAHKVIVTGKSFSAANPYRLNVGYDDYGISLREMFFSVIPNPQWPSWTDLTNWQRMCIILAALGSGFGSCWVDENEPTRNVSINTIKRFPLPTKLIALEALADAGNEMVAAVQSGSREALMSASMRLEDTVSFAYELSPYGKDIMRRRLAGASDRMGVVRYVAQPASHEQSSGRATPSFGHVLRADENGLTVWIAGWTDLAGMDTRAPLQMPGWLCRSGADFVIAGDAKSLDRSRYTFHRADWLTEEQLTSQAGPGY